MPGFTTDCRDARKRQGIQLEASAGVRESDDGVPKAEGERCSISGDDQTLNIL